MMKSYKKKLFGNWQVPFDNHIFFYYACKEFEAEFGVYLLLGLCNTNTEKIINLIL